MKLTKTQLIKEELDNALLDEAGPQDNVVRELIAIRKLLENLPARQMASQAGQVTSWQGPQGPPEPRE